MTAARDDPATRLTDTRPRRLDWAAGALRHAGRPKFVGGLAAVAIAAMVFSQFNLYNKLSRDSAIYVYGGQRFTHGVPPYASIMDPKGPMSGILCGFGVTVARLFGRSDLLVVRAEFCALAILSVLGIYLLVLDMWHSVAAGIVAAAVLASFKTYAHEALAGPDGHAPGVVFLIFAMWLTVRRRWYWAGCAASLAFLSWQPLVSYPVVAVICAAVWSPGRRLRAAGWSLAGCATPLVMLIVYYAAEGYPGKLFEGTFVFPLTGVHRRHALSVGGRLHYMFQNILSSYGNSAILLWTGLALLLVLAVGTVVAARSEWRAATTSPIILLVMLSLVLQVAYVLYDYNGWTHAFPLLPYAAIGIGGTAAHVVRALSWPRARQVTTAFLLAGAAALTATYAVAYYQPSDSGVLRGEQASACAIQRSLAPGTKLWVIDDPEPLVLLHRANPDNYPYVGSGLAEWKVKHTPGGFAGWTGQIAASASIVVMDLWRESIPLRDRMHNWLATHGYRRGFIGRYQVYVTNAAAGRMAAHSIRLTRREQAWPLTTSGGTFRVTQCSKVVAG